MNSTIINTSTNQNYSSVNESYFRLGYIYTLEIISLVLLTPVSIFGFVINTIGLIVLKQPQFHQSIFSYLSYVYFLCIISDIASMIHAFTSSVGYSLVPLANTRAAQLFEVYVFVPCFHITLFAKMLTYMIGVVDVYANFEPSNLSLITRIKPTRVFMFVIMVSILINFPYLFLLYEPSTAVLRYSNGQEEVINYIWPTTWSKPGTYGFLIMIVILIIKHTLAPCVQVAAYFGSSIRIRRYANKKSNLNLTSASMIRLDKRIRFEKNMLRLNIVTGLTTVLHNGILLAYGLCYLIKQERDTLVVVLEFVGLFISVARDSSYFFLLYRTNPSFKKDLDRKLFQLKLNLSVTMLNFTSRLFQ